MTEPTLPRMVLVSGFLGAGKTTLLREAALRLTARGHRPVVVTNDQGEELVDTSLVRTSGLDVGEVTDGCFCCRFDDLVDVATSLVRERGADIVLAEAVGSCTDIAATVVRPLRAAGTMTVVPLTTVAGTDRLRHLLELDGDAAGAVDPSIRYLFEKQIEEAEVLVLNKTDLCGPEDLDELRWVIGRRWPDAAVMETVARTGGGLDALIDRWLAVDAAGPVAPEHAVDVDYDRYARAEALMGWLNARLAITAADGPLSARNWIIALGHGLRAELPDDVLVGHLKVHLEVAGAATKASLVSLAGPLEFDRDDLAPQTEVVGLINARIGCPPETLGAAVRSAVRTADAATGATSVVERLDCFSPARPVPTHRIPAGA